MSSDPEFANLLNTLLKSPVSAERMDAAHKLGRYANNLNDEEYEAAKSALNRALADPDPMVLMSAMQALGSYTRQSQEDYEDHIEGDDQDEILKPLERSGCRLCGRPEALIPEGGCERDDCPYR